uniref:Coagulation factor V-like n=1 Tax=Hippocampus comes TaxID=109280 RepID=A0A3Q2YNM2_HIPCM
MRFFSIIFQLEETVISEELFFERKFSGSATPDTRCFGHRFSSGCSVPLGMENGLIEDRRISASSVNSNWYFGAWSPFFARLNKQGAVNAWQAKYRDMKQWLQVELPDVMKITGIVTQGAKSLGKEMYVTTYTLKYSDNGIHWRDYAEDEDRPIFFGNTDNNEHVKNFIYPPIFSRFIRIIPRTWMGSITLRVELLGCNFE